MKARVHRLIRPRPGWLSALAGLCFILAGFTVHPVAGLITLGAVSLIAEWRVSG